MFIPGPKHFGTIAGEANKVQDTIQTNQRVNLSSWGENEFSHSTSGPERRYSFCLSIFVFLIILGHSLDLGREESFDTLLQVSSFRFPCVHYFLVWFLIMEREGSFDTLLQVLSFRFPLKLFFF